MKQKGRREIILIAPKMRKSLFMLGSKATLASLVSVIDQMAEINEILGERFKVKSYKTAAASLRSLGGDGTSEERVIGIGDVSGLPGVGAKIQKKLEEVIDTGVLEELERLKKEPLIAAVANLTRVHGVGPQKAKQLFDDHQISTVEELRQSISDVSLTDAQAAGLEFFDDIQLRIPHDEVAQHESILQTAVRDCLGSQYITTVCGSYRRKLQDSGDVDALLAINPNSPIKGSSSKSNQAIKQLEKFLTEQGYWLRTLAIGSTKSMGICRLDKAKFARRVDIRMVSSESFPSALLYFTGSKAFNVRMRQHAAGRGFTLNEYGLFHLPSDAHSSSPRKKSSSKLSETYRVKGIFSEEDIFQAIGLPFLKPEDRFS